MRHLLLAISFLILGSGSALAAVITFETTPLGGTPLDDSPLTSFYTITGTQLSFGFDTNGDLGIDVNARFEDHNPPGSNSEAAAAYTNADGTFRDRDLTGTNAGGNFMLRSPFENGIANIRETPFLITYAGNLPTSAAGQIWDVDGPEEYLIEAFNAGGNLIASMTASGTLDLDERPFDFAFAGLSSPIGTIRIRRTDTSTPRGFAFDNFDALGETVNTAVPEPSSVLLGGGLIGLLAVVRRNRRCRGVKSTVMEEYAFLTMRAL